MSPRRKCLRKQAGVPIRRPTSAAFAVLYANGDRNHRTAGFALPAIILNTSMTAAARAGTLSAPVGTAPAAAINGTGPLV